MAKLICQFQGVRGRILKLYDTKCVIVTEKTLGSLITGNITDGEKTIFLSDIIGVQFKKSGNLIGYLQFETSSMQMNNQENNMFSENTFTFEHGKNGITNGLMRSVYNFVTDRLEEIKFGTRILETIPDFESMKEYGEVTPLAQPEELPQAAQDSIVFEEELYDEDNYIDTHCPHCGEPLSLLKSQTTAICPWCNRKISIR